MIELSNAESEKSLEGGNESGVGFDENEHNDEVHSLISIDEKQKERSIAEDDDMGEDQTKRSAYYMDLDIPEKHLDRYPSTAIEEVNPFIILTKDDEDDASIGMESVFGAKMLPQFDGNGDFFDDYELSSQPIKNVLITALETFKYLYSIVLLVFCVVLVMAGIFTKQSTAVEYNIHPIGAFFLFWFLILWLAVIEGGQGCLVGLQAIDKRKYEESHPYSLKNTLIAHKGDNMERFIVGRQFLTVLVIFLINLCGSAIKDADPLGLPKGINDVFLGNGIAMMITTIVIGQLTSQVNAALCMLDFINNYFMLLTTYVSLAIEFSGLLHCVYLVQYTFALITKKPVESKEPKRGIISNLFFWGRVVMSTAILCFALAVTIKALLTEQSGMYEGVPVPISILVFFILMFVVGLMEGMQIAAFALLNMPKEELEANKVAASNCKLMFQDQNLQAFLIGRQIFVASLIFIVAKIATISIEDGEDNIFGVSDGFQSFLDTGLLGAVVLTIIGSLAWRIIAASFPLAFMSNPVVNIIIRICLLLENTGICSSAWILARTNKKLVGLQPDDVYLEEAPRHGSAPVTKRDKDIEITNSVIKYICSTAALIFCITIVMSGIFSSQTVLSKNVHPSFAFLLFWFLISWLAIMEGGQGSLVGLQRVDSSKYEHSHPKAHKIVSVAHEGKNMERFILGRQFLVVLFIFFINLCGRPTRDASIFDFSDTTLIAVTLENSLAMMFVTIVIGQLASQVNAATCMLDFIDNYFMLVTTYISLGVEFSGVLHVVYIVQYVFEQVAGTPTESTSTLNSNLSRTFFWLRVALSTVFLLFSLAVTIEALATGKGGLLQDAGPAASIIIFFALLCFTGILEGIQVAAFALLRIPEEEVLQHGVAAKNSKMIFSNSSNLQAFMVGRQVLVTSSMFIIANIVEIEIQREEENIFGVNSTFQGFVNAGFLGAIVLTIFGSLAWRIVASSYPLAFMSNPIAYLIIRVCLLIAGTGICSSAILLAFVQKSIVNYFPDEEYIGNFDTMDKSQYAGGSSYGYSLLRYKRGGLDKDGDEEEQKQEIPDGLNIMFQSKHKIEEGIDSAHPRKDQSLPLLFREGRNEDQNRVGESDANTITSSFMFPIGLNDSIQRLP